MTDADLTAIQLVVDRSGSMTSIRADMEGAIKEFLVKQAKEPGKALVWLSDFDDVTVHHISNRILDPDDPISYTLSPRGSTALYDAVGACINRLGKELKNKPEVERPGKVLFVIITDGGENSSKEFNKDKVFQMVTHQTDTFAWEFVYLGANQDAYGVSADLGISYGNTSNYHASTKGVATASASLSNLASTYRGSGVAGFTDEDRKANESTK